MELRIGRNGVVSFIPPAVPSKRGVAALTSSSSIRQLGPPVTLVLALALALASTPADAITYGVLDTSHSYVGAIIVDLEGRFGLGIIEWCSGTLIAPRVFLTAGHCTVALDAYEIPRDKIWVSFAPNIWQDRKFWRPIDSYVTHPEYWWGPNSDPHDLGAVLLVRPVRGIDPGLVAPLGYLDRLAADGALARAVFANVGYGSDERGEVTGWRGISYSEFRSLHDAWLYMSQNFHTGSGGTCYGDSGGPTLHRSGATEVVVAVTSWGDAMCVATNNNYRVDTESSQKFIAALLAVAG